MTAKDTKEAEPLLPEEGEATVKEPLRPMPIRAIHAGLHFVFVIGGKEYGWAGFCLLVLGTAASVATSVHVNWLAGCAMMMVFFASSFCFAGFQAVSGRYELARPIMLAAMMLFLSCILGGHFFVEWAKSAGSELIKDAPLAKLSTVAKDYQENAIFYLKDGAVATEYMGEYKLCKDKLPVVGTCVYNYYCVAPVLDGASAKGMPVYAWVGVMSHVACDSDTFMKSPERQAWNHPYRAGLGVERDRYYNDAIDESIKKSGFKTTLSAPLLKWMKDPTFDERAAWHQGWVVEFTVFIVYLIIMVVYSYCVGFTEDALPTARKIMDPDAPQKPARRKKVDP